MLSENDLPKRRMYESMLENSPIAMYLCDSKGYITFYNSEAVNLWGRKPRLNIDLWCGSWKIQYPDGSNMPLEICPMAMTLQLGKSFSGTELVIERPDGTRRTVLVYPEPLFDDDNKVIGACNTLVDITDRKKEEEDRAFLASIITSSEDAIISKNLQGIITSWNCKATEIFGYSSEEAIGQSIMMLIPKNRYSEESEILRKIAEGKLVRHYETERVTKSGKHINISLTISPIKNQQGIIIGASKVARDITAQLAIRKKLKQYNKELEQLNQHKEDFMSLASHELKTPLTSAKAYVQLLAKNIEGYNAGHEFIERAILSISRLEKLVNDLLDVSKIKAGQLQCNMELINFNDIIYNSIENTKYLTKTHTILIKETADVALIGDQLRLEQVLNNLLSNAIKYSPDADSIEIESKKEGNTLIVSVRDFGIGIPEQEINKIVERYYRVNFKSQYFTGLGIGLYLVTEILNQHNGKMLIDSAVNEGSVFRFLLPLDIGESLLNDSRKN